MSSLYMGELELFNAEATAIEAVKQVAYELKDNFGEAQYTTKAHDNDWVTKWDALAEEQIIEELRSFSADVGFVGEESGASGENEAYWTIDPIDGTNSYVRRLDTCTTMIALIYKGVPLVSVINDFMRDDLYTAVVGEGAYLNNKKRLHVSSRPFANANINTYLPHGTEASTEIAQKIRAKNAKESRVVSAGHTFINIARGAIEGFVSHNNPHKSVWDYAPGALLVQEAGGRVANIDGETYTHEHYDFIASNPDAYSHLRRIVRGVGSVAISE